MSTPDRATRRRTEPYGILSRRCRRQFRVGFVPRLTMTRMRSCCYCCSAQQPHKDVFCIGCRSARRALNDATGRSSVYNGSEAAFRHPDVKRAAHWLQLLTFHLALYHDGGWMSFELWACLVEHLGRTGNTW